MRTRSTRPPLLLLTRTLSCWTSHRCPDSAMGTRLLCWATLCLLGAELTEGGVAQSPRHKITEERQAVALWCDPISGHSFLYWYRQTLEQDLELLILFEETAGINVLQSPKNRFSAERPSGANSTLKIQSAELGDSAVYLCASSLATALQTPLLPVHKPHDPPSLWSSRQLETEATPYSSSRKEKKWVAETIYDTSTGRTHMIS
ncbi:hypothetical protein CB1_000804046 [Camelus ferus]|nr:hypothetical protein CB1_000804046 [Camelus ferus]